MGLNYGVQNLMVVKFWRWQYATTDKTSLL